MKKGPLLTCLNKMMSHFKVSFVCLSKNNNNKKEQFHAYKCWVAFFFMENKDHICHFLPRVYLSLESFFFDVFFFVF